MTRRTSRQLLLLVILAIAGMTVLAIVTARPDRTSPVADYPLATPILGLLVAALGVLIFVDRELALEIYWRGAPRRPSDRVILMIVRTFCVLLTIAGLIAGLFGLRFLLGRL